eukprot:gnl/TRDRNA2_/TRDRNA2_151193_c0_seq2.p1 gnl/TRDRNA2_/TRDRNA2_151193_c0~~gnl/TRDRNA2_/TRDRNA2_151193_c0_seq2.p1  ORF type:complete len:202 (-),score=43.58 gnl/TRDRNA2_/TRDRNA2_151193_c0_seq2:40-645(-)
MCCFFSDSSQIEDIQEFPDHFAGDVPDKTDVKQMNAEQKMSQTYDDGSADGSSVNSSVGSTSTEASISSPIEVTKISKTSARPKSKDSTSTKASISSPIDMTKIENTHARSFLRPSDAMKAPCPTKSEDSTSAEPFVIQVKVEEKAEQKVDDQVLSTEKLECHDVLVEKACGNMSMSGIAGMAFVAVGFCGCCVAALHYVQ